MGAPRAAALRSSSLKKVSKPGCGFFFPKNNGFSQLNQSEL
jgi:hypothetical protein